MKRNISSSHETIPTNGSEFTYHRHSEESNMIYFRCSDKKCKARVLFNKQTLQFIAKNNHITHSLHKPNSRKAISGLLMAKVPSIIKGPIYLYEGNNDEELLSCNEIINSPSAGSGNSRLGHEILIKVLADDIKQAENFCENFNRGKFVGSAVCFYIQKKIKHFPREVQRKIVVECETIEKNKQKVIDLAKSVINGAVVEVFRKL